MDETFFKSSKIDRAEISQLNTRFDQPALKRSFLMFFLYLLVSYFAIISWEKHWSFIVVTQIAFAMINCSVFACLHETAHNTAFKSRKLNKLVAFGAGLLHIYPSVAFRELHFTHHRFTHQPGKDPETSIGNKPLPSVISTIPSYVGWLSGLPLFTFKLAMTIMGALGMPEPIRKLVYPFIRPGVRLKLFFESLTVISFNLGIVLIALYWHVGFLAIILGQFVSHSLLSFYLTMEHNGLPHEGDIMTKTRSIVTPKFIKLIMWNMPYHAEHHAFPAVPFHALPALNKVIKSEIKHNSLDHFKFHQQVIKNLVFKNNS